MAVNKVVYNGETLVDLTSDTVTPETLAEGTTAHDASGQAIEGTMVPVLYTPQTPTAAQQAQARANLNVPSTEEMNDYAVNKSGDTMTGSLHISTESYPTIYMNSKSLGRESRISKGSSTELKDVLDNNNYSSLALSPETTSEKNLLRLLTKKNGEATVERQVYHTGNKPTAADVGAVPSSGGTFTGTVIAPTFVSTNYSNPIEIGKHIDMHLPNSNNDYDARITLGADKALYLALPGETGSKTLITTGNKNLITADDIGAVNKAGDTMTGALNLKPSGVAGHGQLYKNAGEGFDYGTIFSDRSANGSLMALKLDAERSLARIANGSAEYDIYHTGNKNLIKPEDIGAAPAYTYGTTDLTAGTSSLATGKLYIVYE